MGVASNTNAVRGFAGGGSVPRQTEIAGQPHMLAYINPREANLLKGLGGSGLPGPGGVPAFNEWSFAGWANDTFGTSFGDGSGGVATNKPDSNDDVTYAPTNTSVDFSLPGSDDPVATIDYGDTGTPTNVTYYDDDDDDDPVVTTTTTPTYTDTSNIAGISDASGTDYTNYDPTANDDDVDTSYVDTSSIAGISDASGVDYDPTAGDDDVDTSDVDDVFGSGNIFTEETDGASTVDFGIGDNAGTTDTTTAG